MSRVKKQNWWNTFQKNLMQILNVLCGWKYRFYQIVYSQK